MKCKCEKCGIIKDIYLFDITNAICKKCNGKFKLQKQFNFYYLAILFIISSLIISSFYTISAGERGVLLTFGKPSMDAVGEGLHFKIPISQSVKVLDVKTNKLEKIADSTSKDLQDIQTTIALNYHLSSEQTPLLYQNIGIAYEDRIINPAIEETVKSVSARFSAEELVTKRPEVRNDIMVNLKERLEKFYIIVDDFNIVNFQFSEEFDKAIEAKVTAEQQALKAQRDLDRIKIEKEQKITQAQAEAESIRIQSEALKQNPDILQLRAIEKWDGIMPKVTGGAMPFVDVQNYIE